MKLEKINLPPSPSSESKTYLFSKILHEIPIEGIAFLVGSLALRIFSASLSAPLLGIGLSIIITRLVLKTLDCYNPQFLVNLTKEACKFNKNYPKVQLITFIFALAMSILSKTFSFLIGAFLGSFGSIILDVESYKLLQQANRKI